MKVKDAISRLKGMDSEAEFAIGGDLVCVFPANGFRTIRANKGHEIFNGGFHPDEDGSVKFVVVE